jgi:hypothetical protein
MRGPMGNFVRQSLSWGIVSALLLPILLSVVTGLRTLLAALGDDVGARFCGRVALAVAVVWLLAVVATSILAGLAALDAADRGCGRRGGRIPRPHRTGRRRSGRRRPHRHEGDESAGAAGDDGLGSDGRLSRRDAGAG